MGARLVVDVNEKDDISFVTLAGVIDEDNDLSEITQRISKKTTIINTANVERINSCGVRDWVNWLGELTTQGMSFYFIECSPSIMAQVNLVSNFVGSGRILNFYAPYFCSSCDSDKMLLINGIEAMKADSFSAPACRCDQCDHSMEFDDIESSYFAFLATTEAEDQDTEVLNVVKQHSSEEQGKLRSRITHQIPSPMGGTPTSTSDQQPSISVTIPNSRDLKGMLTEVPTFDKPRKPAASSNKILYLVLALLAIAIGLLGYVVVRSM